MSSDTSIHQSNMTSKINSIKRKRRKSFNVNKISSKKAKHVAESNRSSKHYVDQKTKMKDLRCVYDIPPMTSSRERTSNNQTVVESALVMQNVYPYLPRSSTLLEEQQLDSDIIIGRSGEEYNQAHHPTSREQMKTQIRPINSHKSQKSMKSFGSTQGFKEVMKLANDLNQTCYNSENRCNSIFSMQEVSNNMCNVMSGSSKRNQMVKKSVREHQKIKEIHEKSHSLPSRRQTI